MKRLAIVGLVLALMAGALCGAAPGLIAPARCEGAAPSLPNPRDYFDPEGSCAYVNHAYEGTPWEVWFFDQGENWGEALTRWLADCESAGLRWTIETAEGYTAYAVYGGGAKALLIPNYQETLMLMKQYGLEMAGAVVPVPEPTPAPVSTPMPLVEPTGGHYEREYVDKPCPFCHSSGICRDCHGTGTFHMYGQAVPCNPDCVACEGTGSISELVLVWVSD